MKVDDDLLAWIELMAKFIPFSICKLNLTKIKKNKRIMKLENKEQKATTTLKKNTKRKTFREQS